MQKVENKKNGKKMKVVITTAMNKEYNLVIKALGKIEIRENDTIYIIKTGIGKVNAAHALSKFMSKTGKIDKVISVGCAGSLTKSLVMGDIIVGNSYCYHDVYCGEPNANGQVQGLPAVFPSSFMWIKNIEKYNLVAIASGDWFVQSREKAEAILSYLPKSYNICAVDMESAALAQVCYQNSTSFTSIRVISDNPLGNVQKEQYDTFWDIAEEKFSEMIKIIAND